MSESRVPETVFQRVLLFFCFNVYFSVIFLSLLVFLKLYVPVALLSYDTNEWLQKLFELY